MLERGTGPVVACGVMRQGVNARRQGGREGHREGHREGQREFKPLRGGGATRGRRFGRLLRLVNAGH